MAVAWQLGVILGWMVMFVQPAAGGLVRQNPVPGRIDAENYETNEPGASGHVAMKATTDAGGGSVVGGIAPGECLNYGLNVETTAVYRIAFRVAPVHGQRSIRASLDGLPLCSVFTPPAGSGETWLTLTVSNLVFTGGRHLLRLDFPDGSPSLHFIQITHDRNWNGGFLRASGQRIVDGQGHNVVLRGMGLGNWMLQEPYMMDVNGIAATQHQLKLKISELVGPDKMEAFYTAWLTNYITDADVAALAAAGFNSIRLPMHYNLFTLPVEREPVPGHDTWLANGFKLVDDLLASCAAHHIYLILDMHACPGGEGQDQPISDYNPPAPSLWESAANRAKLVALWQKLAARYANRTWIGGYDLINEPNWTFENNENLHGCDDQTNAPLRRMFMDLTAAIRQVDTNHMIILEGNCWAGNYRGLLPPWDDNMVISFHKYWDQPTAASLQRWVDERNQWNMPLWLGESGENSDEWFRDVVRCAEQDNIGWCWWPWKKIGTITGPLMIQKPAGYQAILNYWNGNGPRPSTNDAFQGLMALAKATRYENCMAHPDVIDALMRPDTRGITLPFKTNAMAGIIFAADYDLGRYGEAYLNHTTNNPYNTGGAYRNESVDIEVNKDHAPTMGYDVGWLEAGDWMKYTVSLPPGRFAISPRVAALTPGGQFHVVVGNNNIVAIINVPATGGWQSWTTLAPHIFTNASTADSLRVVVDTGGFNLNWLEFTNLTPPAPTELRAVSGSVPAHFDGGRASGMTNYNTAGNNMGSGNHTTTGPGLRKF